MTRKSMKTGLFLRSFQKSNRTSSQNLGIFSVYALMVSYDADGMDRFWKKKYVP